MEVAWNKSQEEKMKIRLEKKLEKAKRGKDYTNRLLKDCKSWGGPCTSVDELKSILEGINFNFSNFCFYSMVFLFLTMHCGNTNCTNYLF